VASYGILTIGGIIALILGSLMLFRMDQSYYRVSLSVILPTAFAITGFFVVVFGLTWKAQRQKPRLGREGLIGEEGTTRTRLNPGGSVFVHGEIWKAEAEEPVEEGEPVIVERVDQMTMKVRKK